MRKRLDEPFIKQGFDMRLGIFQALRLLSRIDQLTAAIRWIALPLKITLCLQIGSLLGHGAFIRA